MATSGSGSDASVEVPRSDASGEVPSREALEELDAELVVCAICSDRYNDPRMLPCAHGFCKDCIDSLPVELENGQQVVKCPTCQKPTQLSDAGAAALPAAIHIKRLMAITLKEKNSTTRTADEPTFAVPPQPDPPLQHQRDPPQPHQPDPPPPDQPDPPRRDLGGLVPRCHSHENRPMDLYCETCEEHTCVRCVTETHRSHKCEHAEVNLFTKYKEKIRKCLQPVRERIGEVEQTLAKFDTREREMREQEEAVQKELK